jgi:hypothetical protein
MKLRPCSLVHNYQRFEGICSKCGKGRHCYPEDGKGDVQLNVGSVMRWEKFLLYMRELRVTCATVADRKCFYYTPGARPPPPPPPRAAARGGGGGCVVGG